MAINDPMHIAVDLGLNSDPPSIHSSQLRESLSQARSSHNENAPVSQHELRQIFIQLQRQ